MLLKNHRYDEAVDKARRLVVEQGPNLTCVNLLGVAALAKGDLDIAAWAFDLVLALDPGFLPAKLNLAELGLRQGGVDPGQGATRSHHRGAPGERLRNDPAGPLPGGPGPAEGGTADWQRRP